MIEVSLFPIPNMVSFPNTIVPLHVFEPRYRAMIKNSFEEKRRVGVCHIKKTLREAKEGQSVQETLSTNQAYYEPQEIFSAGFVEINDVTEDGRLHIDIKMDGRYKIHKMVQEIPYTIALCELIPDEPLRSLGEAEVIRRSIDDFIVQLAKKTGADLSRVLQSNDWQELTIEDYTFSLFQFFRLDPDIMQALLEITQPLERLQFIARVLNISTSQ